MIGLADPRGPLDRTLLDAPGGFAWWYMDAVDVHANGCVLIWSFGLPFLPGRGSSARRGAPRTPRSDPSLNIALYKEGKTKEASDKYSQALGMLEQLMLR